MCATSSNAYCGYRLKGAQHPAGAASRRITVAVEPEEEEDRQLREDWEELMDMIVLVRLSGSPLVTGNIYR